MTEYHCLDCGEVFIYDPFLADPDTMEAECPKCKSHNLQDLNDEEDEI